MVDIFFKCDKFIKNDFTNNVQMFKICKFGLENDKYY